MILNKIELINYAILKYVNHIFVSIRGFITECDQVFLMYEIVLQLKA